MTYPRIKNLTLTFLAILFCLTSTVVWSETKDDLVEREGLCYKKFTNIPYTGKVTGKWQGSFKNGKRDGYWVGYWSNGQLEEKDEYKNGKKEGSWIGYKGDTVLRNWTGSFRNGVKILKLAMRHLRSG